jgi:hypothetical protein
MPLNAWLRRTAAALVLLAAILPLAARALAGPRGAIVHVRWDASLPATERTALETRHRLADGQRLDAVTFQYDLLDTSPENIRALVAEPAADDTHHLDRPNAALDAAASRTARRLRFGSTGAMLVTVLDRLAIASAAIAVLLLLVSAAARVPQIRTAGTRLRGGRDRMRTHVVGPTARFLQRGIPEIDARTAGLFRIVFGTSALTYFLLYPVDASWLSRTFDLEIDGALHQAVIEWLRTQPRIVDLIGPWLLLTGVGFIAGLFTHVSYALFVAGAVLWAYVAVSVASTHPQSILILTLVALLPSRWGDALSVDAWRRAAAGTPIERVRSVRYGYSVWVPTLVFGVSFAAAAWAKLTVPPSWTSWIANGTVKYHFITDSVNAPVQWGLALVQHPSLAVIASFLALATELLVVTAAFVRSDWYRLAMGLGAVGLVFGFWLFMGVAWPGWWVPMLAFLPWQRLADRLPSSRLKPAPTTDVMPASRLKPAPTAAGVVGAGFSRLWGVAISRLQLAVIIGVVAQQVVVSSLRLERAPMFSWYDMYSGTYSSPAAFNASRAPRFRILAMTSGGTVEFGCNPHEEFVRQFEAALAGAPGAQADVWTALSGCGDVSDVSSVVLDGDVRTFDFDRLEFTSTPSARVLGPLPRPSGAIAPVRLRQP